MRKSTLTPKMIDSWLILDSIDKSKILEIGSQLGKPAPSRPGRNLIDVIRPKNTLEAPKNSLSGTYGLNRIPLHTDGAYLETPPRFVLLHFEGKCSKTVSTSLLSNKHISEIYSKDKDYSYHLYCIKNKKSFYSPILNKNENEQTYLRFNRDCMFPVSPSSAETIEDLYNKIQANPNQINIPFKNNQMIVINNWNALHGRSMIPEGLNFERVINRLFIF